MIDTFTHRLFSPCWFWAQSTNRNGYARVVRGGKTRMVHRAAYEEVNGKIPCGLVIDHLCRRRNCLNPEHMETTTVRINTLRGQGPTAKRWREARRRACLLERTWPTTTKGEPK